MEPKLYRLVWDLFSGRSFWSTWVSSLPVLSFQFLYARNPAYNLSVRGKFQMPLFNRGMGLLVEEQPHPITFLYLCMRWSAVYTL